MTNFADVVHNKYSLYIAQCSAEPQKAIFNQIRREAWAGGGERTSGRQRRLHRQGETAPFICEVGSVCLGGAYELHARFML